jgi:tetratricopeptide (TPR) repeat protein
MKKNIKTIYFNLLITVAAAGLAGCDDFLSEAPSKTAALVVSSAEQLDAVMARYQNFYQATDRNGIYATDDYGLLPEIYQARSASYSLAGVEFALWDTDNLAFDSRIAFWPNEFKKIFYANLVLTNIGSVTGEGAHKAELVAEAYLTRAYSYFELAQNYCLPLTDATRDELGLPLKRSTSFEETDVRATLGETYDMIEADLAEALKITTPLVKDGRLRHWRGNTAAANAFAARYWLVRGDYAKAQEYAEKALGEYSTLVDYNTEMHFSALTPATLKPIFGNDTLSVKLDYPYTHDNQTDMTDMLGWKEFYLFRLMYHESWWYVPSPELLALYDGESDLRYKYHIVEGYSYDRGMLNPGYDYPGYVFFYKDRIPSGPTVAEMLLTKAECQARQGDYAAAMSTVNVLRAKRMSSSLPSSEINLTASSREEAVKKILEERRREMPFSHRWMDIRRLNNNEDAFDDVTLTRQFYPYNSSAVQGGEPLKTYTLEKGSRRWAAPIPNTELISSNGKILQNKY